MEGCIDLSSAPGEGATFTVDLPFATPANVSTVDVDWPRPLTREKVLLALDGVLESEAGDEYKLIYHQTFKAASFAFRARWATQTISQSIMRQVVDQLLDLFFTDPFGPGEHESGFGSQTKASQLEDLATSLPLNRSSGEGAVVANWTTPTKRSKARSAM